MASVFEFGVRRRGKSLLPQDQVAKRNQFDDSARKIACILRRAMMDAGFSSDHFAVVGFKTDVELEEFLRLAAALKRRRR